MFRQEDLDEECDTSVKLYDKDGQFNGYLKVSTSTGANIPEGL